MKQRIPPRRLFLILTIIGAVTADERGVEEASPCCILRDRRMFRVLGLAPYGPNAMVGCGRGCEPGLIRTVLEPSRFCLCWKGIRGIWRSLHSCVTPVALASRGHQAGPLGRCRSRCLPSRRGLNPVGSTTVTLESDERRNMDGKATAGLVGLAQAKGRPGPLAAANAGSQLDKRDDARDTAGPRRVIRGGYAHRWEKQHGGVPNCKCQDYE